MVKIRVLWLDGPNIGRTTVMEVSRDCLDDYQVGARCLSHGRLYQVVEVLR